MSYRVSITPTGRRSVDALRGKARRSFDAAVERPAAEGCAAGDASVVVLLVGEHLADDSEFDVYRDLYRQLGLREPAVKRTKPPCCEEDGEPPVDPELLDRFAATARELSRRRP